MINNNDFLSETTHRRYNPLTGDWVLVSPHRNKRPWQGKTESAQGASLKSYEPECYLCPGNVRANGEKNPDYVLPYAFDNDYAALVDDGENSALEVGLLKASTEQGKCRVICFSPRHDLTLSKMSENDIVNVIRLWQSEYMQLGASSQVNHVQIFENKGAVMGCSNPHPHGQIWAQHALPLEAQKKDAFQASYVQKHGSTLLRDYVKQELNEGQRIVHSNSHFVALVPFWAVWPFEVMILPRLSEPNLLYLSDDGVQQFAAMIKAVTMKYDQVFDTPFPYSAGIHQSPTNDLSNAHWHWHMSFYPPLLRSATVKKFMVGYEMFGEPQRDITAEQAAAILRDLPGVIPNQP